MSNRLNSIRSLIVRIALCATCGIVGIGQGSHAEDDAVSRHRMSTPEQKAKVQKRKEALAELRANAKAAKAEEKALMTERREVAKQQRLIAKQQADALKLAKAIQTADINILKAKEAISKAQYRVLKAQKASDKARDKYADKGTPELELVSDKKYTVLAKTKDNLAKAEQRLALAISKREAL